MLRQEDARREREARAGELVAVSIKPLLARIWPDNPIGPHRFHAEFILEDAPQGSIDDKLRFESLRRFD
jgi:hypothetical protein